MDEVIGDNRICPSDRLPDWCRGFRFISMVIKHQILFCGTPFGFAWERTSYLPTMASNHLCNVCPGTFLVVVFGNISHQNEMQLFKRQGGSARRRGLSMQTDFHRLVYLIVFITLGLRDEANLSQATAHQKTSTHPLDCDCSSVLCNKFCEMVGDISVTLLNFMAKTPPCCLQQRHNGITLPLAPMPGSVGIKEIAMQVVGMLSRFCLETYQRYWQVLHEEWTIVDEFAHIWVSWPHVWRAQNKW